MHLLEWIGGQSWKIGFPATASFLSPREPKSRSFPHASTVGHATKNHKASRANFVSREKKTEIAQIDIRGEKQVVRWTQSIGEEPKSGLRDSPFSRAGRHDRNRPPERDAIARFLVGIIRLHGCRVNRGNPVKSRIKGKKPSTAAVGATHWGEPDSLGIALRAPL